MQFASMLSSSKEPALMLAIACLSANVGAGHICLPLKLLTPEYIFNGLSPILANRAWNCAKKPNLEQWYKLLRKSAAVSDGTLSTPIVLDKERIYLHKMWKIECNLAIFFKKNNNIIQYFNNDLIKSVLNIYFTQNKLEIDWQKIATALAIKNIITIISGATGTGKKITLAKLIAVFFKLHENRNIRIIIAAPTFKVAKKLNYYIVNILESFGLKKKIKKIITEANNIQNIMFLLKKQKKIFYENNNININIIIIYDFSMINLYIMVNLILSLSNKTKFIFIGDQFKLSSVESFGLILDILHYTDVVSYSKNRIMELNKITGYNIPYIDSKVKKKYIIDNLCILKKNYKFNTYSNIGKLIKAINIGDAYSAINILKTSPKFDINYISIKKNSDYNKMLDCCVYEYSKYLLIVKNNKNPLLIIKKFNKFRLLCATREGPLGVKNLNLMIEQQLKKKGYLNKDNIGKPIMIKCNIPYLKLYNGDIGIILITDKKKIRAHFLLKNGNLQIVPLRLLPKYETVFAMTVHKSQWDEFNHTALVLPNKILPLLTRELLYTAVTRAKLHLSIYANKKILLHTIINKINKYSGILSRL